MEPADAVTQEHGGVALEPVQKLPRVGVAADHPRHLQVKGLEGRQLQQKPPQGQIKALVDGRLEIEIHLAEGLGHDVRAKGLAPLHALGGDDHPQGVADGFPGDAGDLPVGDGDLLAQKQLADVFPVQQQVPGTQNGHEPGVLKGHQTPRRRAPGQQHKTPLRQGADESAQGQKSLLLLDGLEIIDEEELPGILRRGEGEIPALGAQAQDGLPLQQGVGHRRFSKAAGGAEKEHPPPVAKGAEGLLRPFWDDNFWQITSPLSGPDDEKAFVVTLYRIITFFSVSVNPPKV